MLVQGNCSGRWAKSSVWGGHLVIFRMYPYLDYGERTNTLPVRSDPTGRKPRGQPDAAQPPTNEMTKEKKLNAMPSSRLPVPSLIPATLWPARVLHDFASFLPLVPPPTSPALHGGPTLHCSSWTPGPLAPCLSSLPCPFPSRRPEVLRTSSALASRGGRDPWVWRLSLEPPRGAGVVALGVARSVRDVTSTSI